VVFCKKIFYISKNFLFSLFLRKLADAYIIYAYIIKLKNYPFLKGEKGIDFSKEKKMYVEIFNILRKNDYKIIKLL